MSFGKAVQLVQPEVLAEYVNALRKYKEACSAYTKIRIASDFPDASDVDIVRHHKAKKVFKLECKAYAQARAKYIAIVRAKATQEPSFTDRELYEISEQTDFESTKQRIRREALLASVDPADVEKIRTATAQREKAKFVSTSDDPTFGDFEPLPESASETVAGKKRVDKLESFLEDDSF